MRIQLHEIAQASKCMRYYQFVKDVQLPSKPKQVSVTEKVIKKCYLQDSATGFKVQWRTIVGWVDSLVFKNINILSDEGFELAKKTSEYILSFLRIWYKTYYLKEQSIAYPDIALECSFSEHLVVGIVPIIKLNEDPVVVIVDDIVYNETQLYNSIYHRGLAYMVANSLDNPNISIQYMAMGVRGGSDIVQIKIGEDEHLRTAKMLSNISTMIAAKIDFPSVTQMCQACPFSRRCKL
jgi:hypothetical protein